MKTEKTPKTDEGEMWLIKLYRSQSQELFMLQYFNLTFNLRKQLCLLITSVVQVARNTKNYLYLSHLQERTSNDDLIQVIKYT